MCIRDRKKRSKKLRKRLGEFIEEHKTEIEIGAALLVLIFFSSWLSVQTEKTRVINDYGISYVCTDNYYGPVSLDEKRACEALTHLDLAYESMLIKIVGTIIFVIGMVWLYVNWPIILHKQHNLMRDLKTALYAGAIMGLMILTVIQFLEPAVSREWLEMELGRRGVDMVSAIFFVDSITMIKGYAALVIALLIIKYLRGSYEKD